MEQAPAAPLAGGAAAAEAGPSSSSGAAATSKAEQEAQQPAQQPQPLSQQPPQAGAPLSRYESQKRRDWNTFLQYLRNHKPPLTLARCSGAHVIEFLRYLDQFGKTKVHAEGCAYFGQPAPPAPCSCPLRQAWGSLDALIGRLRAAYEESGGRPESNPFAARAVRIYLREVREAQAKARGIPYEKKKRKRGGGGAATSSTPAVPPPVISADSAGTSGGGQEEEPSQSMEQHTAAVTPPSASASTASSASVTSSTRTAAAVATTAITTDKEAPTPEGSAPGS